MTNDSRAQRLTDRFDAIQGALELTIGREKAFAVALGAHARLIDTILLMYFHGVEDGKISVEEAHAEIHWMLLSMHSDVCEFLNVDQTEVIHLFRHFEEIINDILKEKG